MDLTKISLAPWTTQEGNRPGFTGLFARREDGTFPRIATFSAVDGRSAEEDADFCRIARAAFDVMMRRGWWAILYDGKWHAASDRIDRPDIWWPDSMSAWVTQHGFDDPFTALVEADLWYREHIEKEVRVAG